MGLVSSDLLDAMKTGVDVGSPGAPMILKLAVTGIKGDWPFLIECGRLQRHFRRAPKRGQSSMQSEGVCHLCLAGYDGIPFTDVSAAPRFEETMSSAAVSCLCLCWNHFFLGNVDWCLCLACDNFSYHYLIQAMTPWETLSPWVLDLPAEPHFRPYILRPDVFHNWHLGAGRYFVASSLVILQQFAILFPGTSVESRFSSMTALWLAYCKGRNDT